MRRLLLIGIVFLSVTGAEHRAYLPHAKVEAHLRALPRTVAVGVMRPGFFAQDLLTAYRDDIVDDDRVYVCADHGKVAFVDTDDIGEVAADALRDGVLDGRAVTLSGAAAVDFDEVAATLTAVLGRPIRYEPASILGFCWHRLRRRRASLMEAIVITALHAGLRRGDGAGVDATLGALLGRPPTSLRAVIERAASALQR